MEDRTIRMTVHFAVKERDAGEPCWIQMEASNGDSEMSDGAMYGLDLDPSYSTYEAATNIAKYLAEHVQGLSMTLFDGKKIR